MNAYVKILLKKRLALVMSF